MAAPLFLNRYQLFSLARIWFLVAINLAVLIYSNIFGTDAGIRLAYFSFVSLPWLIFAFSDWKYILAGISLPVIGFLLTVISDGTAIVSISPEVQRFIYISIVFVVFIILSLSMMFFSYQHFLSEKILIESNSAFIVSQRKLEQ